MHDHRVFGLFPQATWPRTLARAGLDVTVHAGDVDREGAPQPVFVGVRRA